MTTPHVFYGEWTGGTTELLRQGSPLSWGTYYTFSIWRHDPGGSLDDFYFFLNGTFRTSTVNLHNRYNLPWFVGEVNYSCTTMAARAYDTSAPFSTLSYSVEVSGALKTYYFDDRYFFASPYSMSGVNGDRATAYGYGP